MKETLLPPKRRAFHLLPQITNDRAEQLREKPGTLNLKETAHCEIEQNRERSDQKVNEHNKRAKANSFRFEGCPGI